MFENVVVGADDSEVAAEAFRRAVEVAKSSGGTLHIVTAFKANRPLPPPMPEEFRYSIGSLDPVDMLLRELAATADKECVPSVVYPVLADPVEAITKVAREENADLIVVGSKTHQRARHLASVPNGLVNRAPCAVLIV
jgi:nucleotide-binding universal stress UspA family protein